MEGGHAACCSAVAWCKEEDVNMISMKGCSCGWWGLVCEVSADVMVKLLPGCGLLMSQRPPCSRALYFISSPFYCLDGFESFEVCSCMTHCGGCSDSGLCGMMRMMTCMSWSLQPWAHLQSTINPAHAMALLQRCSALEIICTDVFFRWVVETQRKWKPHMFQNRKAKNLANGQ